MMTTKICGRCGKEKSLEDFHRNRTTKNLHQSLCKFCMMEDRSTKKHRKRGLQAERLDRAEIWERDRGICGICNEPIIEEWQLDHILPLNRGGFHVYDNVQVAHASCNHRKQDRI